MRARYATRQWSVQAQHHRATRLRGRLASCQWPLRSVGAIIRSDWTDLPINSIDAYSDCILRRSEHLPNADLQVLPLRGLAIVSAALCLECVSRASNQQSAG